MSTTDMILGSECCGFVKMPREPVYYSKPAVKAIFKEENVREALFMRA
jgi:hypothetical protein